MRRIGAGELVRVTLVRPRNGKHHRKMWALLRIIRENTDAWKTDEDVLFALKMAVGLFDMIPTANGPQARVRSISFSAMDQLQFEAVYDSFCDVIASRVLPGLPADTVRREVEDMIAPNPNYQASRPKRERAA